MARRWLRLAPVVVVLLGGAVLTSAAARGTSAGCGYDTPSVTALSASVDRLDGALVPTPVLSRVGPFAGDTFNDVLATQRDGCLPALPASPPTTSTSTSPTSTAGQAPSTPPLTTPLTTTSPTAPPATTTTVTTAAAPAVAPAGDRVAVARSWLTVPAAGSAKTCLTDTVQLLGALLDSIAAANTSPTSQQALHTATTEVGTALTAVNTDDCLPVALPVPQIDPSSSSAAVQNQRPGSHLSGGAR